MKKRIAFLLSVTAVFSILTALLCLYPFASGGNGEGLSFTASSSYATPEPVTERPVTFEARVFLPKSFSSRGGAIISDYIDATTVAYSMEILNGGNPRIYVLHKS